MDGFDISILAVAAFFAITMLVRMMRSHRDVTMNRLREKFEAEQSRLAAERRRQERAERKRKKKEAQEAYLREAEEKRAA